MNLQELTIDQLKVLAFDNLRNKEIAEHDLKVIMQELSKREANENIEENSKK